MPFGSYPTYYSLKKSVICARWMTQVQGFGFLKLLTRKRRACVINPIPKSTVYKNKWALQIFREWQGQRANKICTIEPSGVFKGEDIGLDVQELTESIENENAKSLNYWPRKFVQEVAN